MAAAPRLSCTQRAPRTSDLLKPSATSSLSVGCARLDESACRRRAARSGKYDITQLLIDNKADKHLATRAGETAAAMARKANQLDALALLEK